jgi:hypothetical protein
LALAISGAEINGNVVFLFVISHMQIKIPSNREQENLINFKIKFANHFHAEEEHNKDKRERRAPPPNQRAALRPAVFPSSSHNLSRFVACIPSTHQLTALQLTSARYLSTEPNSELNSELLVLNRLDGNTRQGQQTAREMQRRKTTSATGPSSQVHQGWLKKKGKRRWFILQSNSLYWFAKEQKVPEPHSSSISPHARHALVHHLRF